MVDPVTNTLPPTRVCYRADMRGTHCSEGHEFTVSASGRNRCLICQNTKRKARRNRRVIRSLEERLWDKVDVREPDECWPWTGFVLSHPTLGGYGQIREAGRGSTTLRVHRVVYELTYGPIPDGLVLDHTCHNGSGCEGRGPACPHRRCCNPAHLEAVTHAVNNERGYHRGESRG